MESTNKESLGKVYHRLSQVEGALKGLAAMFIVSNDEIPLEKEELFGLGYLLQILSQETRKVEDFLRCGKIEDDFALDDDAPYDDDDDNDDDDDDDEKK